MKVITRKGGSGDVYYLRIPRDIVEAFNISKNDEFVLNANFDKDGNLILCYKRVKKS
ncbi:AbrB/MazE/SpoVT family DNA-binding domain-containing protein [Sulfolobus tengchongensis]|uniref:AbrB/MazE/SpoVT family DNA-binding domain-containing protein n=1 Tax=Sulfolobus tengchongensis TaxID=207809 RepID=A0AAX4KZS1_9CREN